MHRRSQGGLTLVETLVAMTILAGVSIAAFALLSQGANFAASERDRLAASIVADNLMVQELLRETPPDLGEDTGVIEFGGRLFAWRRTVSDAGEDLRRIQLNVRLEGSPQALARIDTIRAST
ncbi:MAG: type II secretion system minor pseudopilin GspI [Parvularculaceae bacterium]|nr:type II secretion system minor pseudopilin GspI [Parvularculaceae bacterium]